MDEQKDKDLKTYDRLFNKQSSIEDDWLEYERLYKAQFTEQQLRKAKNKKRSRIFIPTIRNTTNIIKAIFSTAFFGAGNPIEIIALSEDENDKLTDRNKVLKYYYNKLKPNKELNKAFLSSLLYGMGIVITYWDSQKKKVITNHIPITDIAFDSECANIDDVQVLAYRHYESVRVIKQKIESGFYNQKKLHKKLFDNKETRGSKRKEIKVIYSLNQNNKYDSKTFINNILVRVVEFEKLPFQYGYSIEKLPSVDKEARKDEILCYGDSIARLLKEIQHEINSKRNLKNDIQEKILNPDVYVGDGAVIDPKDLTFGAGKRIRVKEGSISEIKERQVPNEYALNADLTILASDQQSAVGINSIQQGETGASDRRSATALSVVNSNSSMRIEEMIMLTKETIFEHWAKSWVALVFKNADDKVINKITGKKNPFGKKGKRETTEYDLRINFGMTIDKEKKINDLLGIYQMTSQNQNINPKIIEGMLKKILDMRIGEDTDLTKLYKEVEDGAGNQENEPSLEDIEKENLKNGSL